LSGWFTLHKTDLLAGRFSVIGKVFNAIQIPGATRVARTLAFATSARLRTHGGFDAKVISPTAH
jgi:hypothetical protein